MRARICVAALLASAAMAALAAQSDATRSRTSAAPSHVLDTASKLLVVTTSDWDSIPGTLARYERVKGRWQQIGKMIPVVVGKNGMAWDRNAVAGHELDLVGPTKREGDGKSPAGVFALGKFFGYAPSLAGSSRYVPLTAETECVDDPASQHYAQVLERSSVTHVDWKSSEQMRRDDELYQWGVIVDYNVKDTVAAAGSCIFLHIWRGPDQGTAGCTAMTAENILALMKWLDDDMASVIVQLPKTQYDRLRSQWHLP